MRSTRRSLMWRVGGVALAVALATTLGTDASSRGRAALQAAWPPPLEEVYNGCPPQGDGGDIALNLRKNRIDTGRWQAATLASLVALPWPRGVEKARRADWPPQDLTTIQKQEGRPVVVEGYFLRLRHEGPESTNCHDADARDYHAWLGAPASESRALSLIAEITPRVAALNAGWGSEKDILRLTGQHVRLSGWVMFDQEHPEQVGKTRATLWEIHPITRIAVERQGRWVDLATGSPGAGGTGSSATATPKTTGAVATPLTTGHAAFAVRVSVSPDPTSDGAPTTITATTARGASCAVRVVYASGSASTAGALQAAQVVGASGLVSWTWTPRTRRPGPATVTVRCTLREHTAQGMGHVTIQ